MAELITKTPSACSNAEIGAFIAFVRAGGEVSMQGLAERVRSASVLVFAHIEGLLVGVAALKHPEVVYQRGISSKSGFLLTPAAFPFELGWVYVLPEARRKGLSLLLSRAAVVASSGAGIFATSRAENHAMHRSLVKLGFAPVGTPYKSARGKHSLQVFARHAAQPVVAGDAPPIGGAPLN